MKTYTLLVSSNVCGRSLYHRWDGSLQPMWRKRSNQHRKSSSLCCDSDKATCSRWTRIVIVNNALTWAKHSNYQPPLMGSGGLWLRLAAWCIWGPVGFDCLISYECPSLLHIQSRHLFLSLFPSLSPCHLLKSSHRAWGPPLSACLKFKLHFCAMPDLP